MTSEKESLGMTLKKHARRLKAHLGFIIGLALWSVLLLIVLFVRAMQLSDRIQAASVITLVFVTMYYAVQTQALVKEEQRSLKEETDKRVAEYGEKRIKEFLIPLNGLLSNLKMYFNVVTNPRNRRLIEQHDDMLLSTREVGYGKFKDFFSQQRFMCNDQLQKRIYGFITDIESSWPTIDNQEDAYLIPWKAKMDKEIDKLIVFVDGEIGAISIHIKKTFQYYINVPLYTDGFRPLKKPRG
jgi:hypothetical protein